MSLQVLILKASDINGVITPMTHKTDLVGLKNSSKVMLHPIKMSDAQGILELPKYHAHGFYIPNYQPTHQPLVGLKNSSKVMLHPIMMSDAQAVLALPKQQPLLGLKNSSKVMLHPHLLKAVSLI